MPSPAKPVSRKSAGACQAFRISPEDTNYFILLIDPSGDGVDLTCVVEIFTRGGKTPPNTHRHAHEVFFVLRGEGIAHADGTATPIRAGDALLVRPGVEHVIENTGASKLYTLTTMVPNEEFAELIRRGTKVAIDAEDRAVLGLPPD
jgi:mannose-6-phosphate isomerase-like protein (cupin superfamily)